MAILMRGGPYEDFDPSKLRPREWAVILENDPGAKDGKTVRICFSAGNTKRMATYEDMVEDIESATEGIRDQYIKIFNEIKAAIEKIESTTEGYMEAAKEKAAEAKISAETAKGSEVSADKSASDSENYSLWSKSYALGEGGVRENESVDSSKFYYEQSKRISQELGSVLLPMGTIYFYELSSDNARAGYTYNIKDAFVTDESFKEGAGFLYPEGTNVYLTADGYWDCLAGVQVTGVKGDAENTYRVGDVNITAEDIGVSEATVDNAGIVKPDGSTITVDEDGTIHGSSQVDIATTQIPGIVKPDGETIAIDTDGTITATASGFTGTKEETKAALEAGEIKDGTIVNITDDYVEPPGGGSGDWDTPTEFPVKTEAAGTDLVIAEIGGAISKITINDVAGNVPLPVLTTTSKTIVGAINELNSGAGGADPERHEGDGCVVYVYDCIAKIIIDKKGVSTSGSTLVLPNDFATLPENMSLVPDAFTAAPVAVIYQSLSTYDGYVFRDPGFKNRISVFCPTQLDNVRVLGTIIIPINDLIIE